MKIRIKKLKESTGSLYSTPDKDSFEPGKDNGEVSLPVDYEVEGIMINTMEVGKSLRIERHKRNGIVVLGLTVTSPIKEITDKTFTTDNSVYTYEILPS